MKQNMSIECDGQQKDVTQANDMYSYKYGHIYLTALLVDLYKANMSVHLMFYYKG